MVIYVMNIILAVLFSTKADLRNTNNNQRKICCFLLLATLITTATIRWNTGTDFWTYRDIYYLARSQSWQDLLSVEKEMLFSIFTWGTYQIAKNNFQFYTCIIACIVYVPIVLTFRKRAIQFMPCILFYILINLYASAFNGMRQWIAVAISFASFRFLQEKKYKLYAFWMLIAFGFHFTVVIVVPFFVIAASNLTMRKKIIIEIILLCACVGLGGLWSTIMNVLSGIGQDKYVDDYSDALANSYGAGFIRVLFELPPIFFSIWRYKYRAPVDSKKDFDTYMHMSIFSAIFMVAGTRFVTIARFSTYFSLYNCLLLPMVIRTFKGRDKVLFTFVVTIIYIAAWYVLLHVDSNLLPFRLKNGMIFS